VVAPHFQTWYLQPTKVSRNFCASVVAHDKEWRDALLEGDHGELFQHHPCNPQRGSVALRVYKGWDCTQLDVGDVGRHSVGTRWVCCGVLKDQARLQFYTKFQREVEQVSLGEGTYVITGMLDGHLGLLQDYAGGFGFVCSALTCHARSGQKKRRSIPSEILLCRSPGQGIEEAFDAFKNTALQPPRIEGLDLRNITGNREPKLTHREEHCVPTSLNRQALGRLLRSTLR